MATLIIHRETRVQTVFSVCDEDGNLLFDQAFTAQIQANSDAGWDHLRQEMERGRKLLQDGVLSEPLPEGAPIPEQTAIGETA